jgi:hypothetical protein
MNATTETETLVATEKYSVAACPTLAEKNCALKVVDIDPIFTDLTNIRINVTVADEPKRWWMDDLRLGWTNNTCAAGLCRINTHIHG